MHTITHCAACSVKLRLVLSINERNLRENNNIKVVTHVNVVQMNGQNWKGDITKFGKKKLKIAGQQFAAFSAIYDAPQ